MSSSRHENCQSPSVCAAAWVKECPLATVLLCFAPIDRGRGRHRDARAKRPREPRGSQHTMNTKVKRTNKNKARKRRQAQKGGKTRGRQSTQLVSAYTPRHSFLCMFQESSRKSRSFDRPCDDRTLSNAACHAGQRSCHALLVYGDVVEHASCDCPRYFPLACLWHSGTTLLSCLSALLKSLSEMLSLSSSLSLPTRIAPVHLRHHYCGRDRRSCCCRASIVVPRRESFGPSSLSFVAESAHPCRVLDCSRRR